MIDDARKETERIYQGIVESLSFSETLAKRDAEIERLRCALEAVTTVEGNIIATDAAKTTEIERLRGELDALQTHFDIKAKLGVEKDAEIERLRDSLVIANTTQANLHSEIDKLRGLVRQVVRSSWPPPPSWYAEAQEAAMLESGEFVRSAPVIPRDEDGAA